MKSSGPFALHPGRITPWLLLLALLLSGCASTGGGSAPGKVYVGNVSNLPQVQLPGASLESARSVAMAAALTKGWDVVSADANRLLLERPLPAGSPQAEALESPLAAPRMQVETSLVERSDGTIVALAAYVLTNPGTEQAKRIDFTKDYENQLLISLSSLSSAWIAARDKIDSEVPVLAEAPDADGATDAVGGEIGDAADTVSAADGVGTVVATETQLQSEPQPQTQPRPQPQSPRQPATAAPVPPAASGTSASVAATQALRSPSVSSPAVAPASGSSVAGSVAPTIDQPPSPRTAEAAASGPMRGPGMSAPVVSTAPEVNAGSNDMLVLNQSSGRGLWGAYAEDYARLHGCKVGPNGASLLRQLEGGELLEVECTGAANVLVTCRGGVCTPVR